MLLAILCCCITFGTTLYIHWRPCFLFSGWNWRRIESNGLWISVYISTCVSAYLCLPLRNKSADSHIAVDVTVFICWLFGWTRGYTVAKHVNRLSYLLGDWSWPSHFSLFVFLKLIRIQLSLTGFTNVKYKEVTLLQAVVFAFWLFTSQVLFIPTTQVALMKHDLFTAFECHCCILGHVVVVIRSSPERWPNKPGKNVRPSVCMYVRMSVRPQWNTMQPQTK